MKNQKIIKIQKKLKKVIDKAIKENNRERALCAINASAHLHYFYNQQYVDEELENALLKIEKSFSPTKFNANMGLSNTILFYDGFGLDMRGLALIYLRALVELNYRIIYVTVDSAKEKQSEIKKILDNDNCVIEYIPWHGKYEIKISLLIQLFEKYFPEKAFLYTTPWDVVGVIAFEHFAQVVKRYQINLTDHTFWLGKYALDICIEFREYGASISTNYRGIPSEKIEMLPYYPYIDYDIQFEGFPFDDRDKKVIFSGGSLYKTFDKKNTYYKLVKEILLRHEEVIFLYAGDGNRTGIEWLQRQFKDRVYRIDERKDLYQIMRHSYLYLNTFPLVGALMMQYAAASACIPVTLKRENCDEGNDILINQNNLGIVFSNTNELLSEINLLLNNSPYIEEKRKKIKQSVISEEKFRENLKAILIKTKKNDYYSYKKFDTSIFLKDYIHRLSIQDCETAILKKDNEQLKNFFPLLFFMKIVRNRFEKKR